MVIYWNRKWESGSSMCIYGCVCCIKYTLLHACMCVLYVKRTCVWESILYAIHERQLLPDALLGLEGMRFIYFYCNFELDNIYADTTKISLWETVIRPIGCLILLNFLSLWTDLFYFGESRFLEKSCMIKWISAKMSIEHECNSHVIKQLIQFK